MLDKLLKRVGSPEIEGEYEYIVLTNVRQDQDKLTLTLSFFADDYINPKQVWDIECVDLLAHEVTLGYPEGLELSYHHVLLWPYLYPTARLSFHGGVQDPLAVVGALYQRHEALVGKS